MVNFIPNSQTFKVDKNVSTEDQPEDQLSTINPSSEVLRATKPGPKLKPLKPKKTKPQKKRKDNQRKERKATQTLAIVLGTKFKLLKFSLD